MKKQLRASEIPVEWASRWDAATDIGMVLAIIHDVESAVAGGDLLVEEAGYVLRPLIAHPISNIWPDGELVAIGVHADNLSLGAQFLEEGEQAYEWDQILQCMKRVRSTQRPA